MVHPVNLMQEFTDPLSFSETKINQLINLLGNLHIEGYTGVCAGGKVSDTQF